MTQMKDVLRTCGMIEEKIAEIYRYLAALFRHAPPLAELFEKTATEEDNHMYQFQLAIKTDNLFCSGMKIDGTAVENALAMATSLFEHLRNNPPTAVQALEFAARLEEKLMEFHMNTAVVFQNQSAQRLFQAMMDNDREHVRSLTSFIADSSMRPVCKGEDAVLFKKERLFS